MSILVLNAGSSSLKFTLLDADGRTSLISGGAELSPGGTSQLSIKTGDGAAQKTSTDSNTCGKAAAELLGRIKNNASIRVVGHRVVHGGSAFHKSVRIDARVKHAIQELSAFAPLHNPPALEVIESAERALPDVPQIAVFDTAFYAKLPPVATVYPLPYEWFETWGLRRYGFHGISHAWSVKRASELMGSHATLRVITCHLGNGCSLTASQDGNAVSTTMGFTPLDGVMMGTRPGSLDPGILIYALKEKKMSAEELDDVLNHGCGLLGVSGVSSDFRAVEAAANSGNERARLALEIYAARVRSSVGALAVTLGGVDALVFTAGVGEHSAPLRAAVCEGLQCLGVVLDAGRNAQCKLDDDIASPTSNARIFVIEAREDLMIAAECMMHVPDCV